MKRIYHHWTYFIFLIFSRGLIPANGSEETLIELRADVNARDELKRTPLFEAAKAGSAQCVDLLLRLVAAMRALQGGHCALCLGGPRSL